MCLIEDKKEIQIISSILRAVIPWPVPRLSQRCKQYKLKIYLNYCKK